MPTTIYLTDDLDYRTYVSLNEKDVMELTLKDAYLAADNRSTFDQAILEILKDYLQSSKHDFVTEKFPICNKICTEMGDYLQLTKPQGLEERQF